MKTILLVEDDAAMLECTLESLQKLEAVKIAIARNGVEAISLIEAGLAFDLLLTDRRMPLMGGEELVAKLRSRGYKQPFILTTGDVSVPQTIHGVDLIIDKSSVFGKALITVVRDLMDARAVV